MTTGGFIKGQLHIYADYSVRGWFPDLGGGGVNSTFYAAPLYEACAYVQPMHSYLTSFKHIMAASTALPA